MRVTLKLATSLDGRIATASGESRWITGDASRAQGHRLRADHAAVLVGVETVIADDPVLSVRLAGYAGPQPARVVLDSRQRIPLASKVVMGASTHRTVLVTVEPSNKRLTDAGVEVLTVAGEDGRVEARAALDVLNSVSGLTSVLIEGGGRIAASFIRRGLVDRIEWFRAPIVLGAEGRAAVGDIFLHRLAEAPRYARTAVETLGDDLWERYERV